MATTSTPRLQLLKTTPGTGELVNVALDLNDNWDKLDLLDKRGGQLLFEPVKRNTADAIPNATNVLMEVGTAVFRANRWYRVVWTFGYNTTLAVGTSPNGAVDIRLKAGGTVAITDQSIASSGIGNINTTSPRFQLEGIFDVPTDGTYTLGCTANSGGANTLNIVASGAASPGNTAKSRLFYVEDKGEKP